VLVRHAEAESNVGEGTTSAVAPGVGLSPAGRNEARALGRALAPTALDLCAVSELRRSQETAAIALARREVPRIVVPELNEIGFGSFEGGALADYRAWAWSAPPEEVGPGGAEPRAAAAARYARALRILLARPEPVVVAVTHAVGARYVLDAVEGRVPRARIERVPHAESFPLEASAVEAAASLLEAWSAAPVFAADDEAG